MNLDHLALVDHHCHGVTEQDLDRPAFSALLSESFRPPPPGVDPFLSPIGLSLRRYCAEILDLEPHCDIESYLQRRSELGAQEVNRRFLAAANVSVYLIDTGHRSAEITAPDKVHAVSGVPVHEIVRIEAVAEDVGAGSSSGQSFRRRFEEELARRAAEAVGLKSVAAYRTTFAIPQDRPTDHEVDFAFERWVKASGSTPRLRVSDPVLIRYGLWTAAELCRPRSLPIQLHVGIGDPDVYMYACDPSYFIDFLKEMEKWEVPVTLLHNYPFLREAGWLSEVLQNVYYDAGFILHFSGPSASRVIGDALEFAPFYKHLYSSDAFGLAEFHYLGALKFRRALAAHLNEWVACGECSADDAERIAGLIGAGNARCLYSLAGYAHEGV